MSEFEAKRRYSRDLKTSVRRVIKSTIECVKGVPIEKFARGARRQLLEKLQSVRDDLVQLLDVFSNEFDIYW
jgi:hypothetical protein